MELLDIKADNTLSRPDIDIEFEYHENGYLIPRLGTKEWDGHIFVTGATGAGKSWIINQIVSNDEANRKIYLFSEVEEDDSFSFISHKYKEGDSLENTICIFDDFEDISLRDSLLLKGRHTNTVVISVNHKIRDWKWSAKPINESKYIIMFPFANKNQIINELVKNQSFSRIIAKKIVDLAQHDGRYLIIHKHAPNAIITQRSIIKL